MSQGDTSGSRSGALVETKSKGSLGWVKLVGGALLLVVGFVLLLKLAGFLLKWAILLALVYGAYRLIRYWLSDSDSDAGETVLQLDEEPGRDALGLLENERELDELKVRMERASSTDD